VRTVCLLWEQMAAIERHGRSSYPDESCGFLIARLPEPESERRDVLEVVAAENEFEGERRRRFAIRPEELRDLERRLEGSGRGVVGFYHSHPDHPHRPSEFDRDHAWPWYTYLVTSITAAGEGPTGAFELDPDTGKFLAVELRVRPPDSGGEVSQTL